MVTEYGLGLKRWFGLLKRVREPEGRLWCVAMHVEADQTDPRFL